MSDFRIPNFYLLPLGGPLNWGDEQSGVLVKAVMAYLNHKETPMFRPHMKILVEYLRYYIHAPCWDENPHHDSETRAQLADMRKRILAIQNGPLGDEREIERWIMDCLEMGIDPL